MQDLIAFRDFEELEDLHEIFSFRCRLDDAAAYIRKAKADLDEQLARHMTEQGVKTYTTGPEGNRIEVRLTKKKTTKVDTKTLTRMLTDPVDHAEKELARRCLSGGQSAWKAAEVQVAADTLGMPLIETTWTDTVEVKAVPVDQLKAMGRIK
jgi:hypothetical protein